MSRNISSIGCLVERTVEGGKEEHERLSTHTGKQHEIGSRQVGQFKEGTQDNDRCTPALCIVQKGLSRHTVHPFLQMIYDVKLTIFAHFYYLLFLFFDGFCFALDVVARLRTQRNPIYERGWF